MTTQQKKPSEELRAILDLIADSILESSDEELLEEATEIYANPQEASEEVRLVLLSAVKAHRQRKLDAARTQYEQNVSELKQQEFQLPDSPAARRALLVNTITKIPNSDSTQLTAQFRDAEKISDKDVESSLKQLHALGLLEANLEDKG